ncbi:hypothetical protein D1007_49656 [Hordeum vulgare]|nr:hypothetical protein D1007_49656 [Hordeum vulgare]
MTPASKRKPEWHGPAPASPLLDCALSKDADLVPVLPLTTAESSKHWRTLIWPSVVEERPAPGVVYPFFLHNIYAGLVPPFSRFFTAIFDHYGIQALHLQPNSILLLSVFAFYCEAFVGVHPSVALLRHFFSLRLHDDAHLSACVSIVAAQSGNMLLMVGKKVDNFRHCWVHMFLKDANPRLEEPEELPEKTSPWSSANLSDPPVVPVLECFSCDISAKRLTGGMIVKKFLAQCLAPLQAHSRPVWEYRAGDDKLGLRYRDLPTEDLSRAVPIFLGGDPGDLTEALGPLYRRDSRVDLVAVMPIFNERGLLPVEGSGPVEVSSGDTSGEGDSGNTVDDRATSVPVLSQSVLLRELEDDDAIGLSRPGAPRLCQREIQGVEVAGAERRKRWRDVVEDVVSPRAKRKKTVVKLKTTPDAPPALVGALPSAGVEEEACGAAFLALFVEPPEPPKHPKATVGMLLPGGHAYECPQAPGVLMPAIVEQFSGPIVLRGAAPPVAPPVPALDTLQEEVQKTLVLTQGVLDSASTTLCDVAVEMRKGDELKSHETKLAAREGELSQEASSLNTKQARLEEQEKELASRKALLDAGEKALATAKARKTMELACFPNVELGLHAALRSLCRD